VSKPAVNWEVSIECIDCHTVFKVHNVNPSHELVQATRGISPLNRSRMFLITVPNECPECRNIRIVKNEEEKQCP